MQDFLESCRASTLLAELTDDELPDPDEDENDDDDNDEDDEDYEEEEECYEVTVRIHFYISIVEHLLKYFSNTYDSSYSSKCFIIITPKPCYICPDNTNSQLCNELISTIFS